MFEPRSIVASPLPDTRPRVLLANDHTLTQELLALFLAADGGFRLSTAAGLDGAVAATLRDGPFDIVLLDIALPASDLAPAVHRMICANAGRPVAVVTDRLSPRQATDLIDAGAAGLLMRSMPARSLPHALRFIQTGERYVPTDLLFRDPRRDAAQGTLSDRQRQVLDGLAGGRANKTIARDLGLAEPTVKMHVSAICRRLGARNRTQAALIARDLGLLASC